MVSPVSPAPASARGGIDLGGTKIQTVVVSARNKVLGEARCPTPTEGGPKGRGQGDGGGAAGGGRAAGVETKALEGRRRRLAGRRRGGDRRRLQRAQPARLGGLVPARGEALEASSGRPVFVGNDVQVAVEAEFHLGAGKPYKTVLGYFWGTGVGGGLILNGKPWLGRGAAGEVGHMVISRGGPRCSAGHAGCMEAYAGRASMEAKARRLHASGEKTDLFKIMEKRGRDRLTSGVWERALEHGDKMAEHLMKRATTALGQGISASVNLLDPEAVVLGGGMGVRFGEEYRSHIEDAMKPYLFEPDNPPPLLLASLGDLGGAIGAALLAKRAKA